MLLLAISLLLNPVQTYHYFQSFHSLASLYFSTLKSQYITAQDISSFSCIVSCEDVLLSPFALLVLYAQNLLKEYLCNGISVYSFQSLHETYGAFFVKPSDLLSFCLSLNKYNQLNVYSSQYYLSLCCVSLDKISCHMLFRVGT